jgi:hypothetical protein
VQLIDECKKHLRQKCPWCGVEAPAYQIFLKHDNEATLVYRCHGNHVWTKKVILDVSVSEMD